MIKTIDPVRYFEISRNGSGEVCQLQSVGVSPGVANNTQLIAAVSGKRIRIMGLFAQSSGAASGSFQFKSGNAGPTLTTAIFTPPNTNGDLFMLPISDSGYWETTTGVGLFTDVTTTGQSMNIFYLVYTPT